MTDFRAFLTTRLAESGFATEDVLVSFLPLLRQTLETHAAGRVAPLEGVTSLRAEGERIWFEQAAARECRNANQAIRRVDARAKGAIEVRDRRERTVNVSTGEHDTDNAAAAPVNAPIERPVFLPGYVAWEHRLGHHDELTDVLSLGLILASLACGLDFHDPADLRQFVEHRDNLFRLCPGLHPVLAKAIVRMTELSRHERPGDLRRILRSLENYRSHDVDFEYDLLQDAAFAAEGRQGKQQIILGKLRQRLFELTRRNRLLHFRPSMGFLDLTQASVPLSFRVESIRPDQILTWAGSFADRLLRGKPVCLNEYLNFDEVLYAAPVLDRIRTESLRDQAEFGFAQLKLSVCFLRWADLKANPPELYDSPLVLLPVELTRKKGVRDTYWLTAIEPVAEINPVVRHQFRHLYDIHLPETIDLGQTDLQALHRDLVDQIGRSDKTVDLRLISKPRIDLLHDRARRRLDSYRRRARLAGRGLRRFLDIDYSYDRANFHPLGLELFREFVRPAESHLSTLLRERPTPRRFFAPPADPPTVETGRQFYSLRDRDGDDPRRWEFDLCRVTLGNLKYRKMTLVKDYDELLATDARNEAFEASFSLAEPPGPIDVSPPPLAERHQVVPCDPTQASAIGLARAGQSYIIQGPPGTGKSQTITNLIADFVARGRRVLFVCEKRAAIDVVHQRLKECGLGELCCLIHDSQADKKQFVMDLKTVSESFTGAARDGWPAKRTRLVEEMERELTPLREYAAEANADDERAGMPVRQLLARAVQLRALAPDLSAAAAEALPVYAEWIAHRDAVGRLLDLLAEVQPDGVLARHPLAALPGRVAKLTGPIAWVTQRLETCQQRLADVRDAFDRADAPATLWESTDTVAEAIAYADQARPLATTGLYEFLDPNTPRSMEFEQAAAQWRKDRQESERAILQNRNWRRRLDPTDTDAALAQARAMECSPLRYVRPSWWRLRKVMRSCYDFAAHKIPPSFEQVLEGLQAEHQAQRTLDDSTRGLAERMHLPADELDPLLTRLRELRPVAASLAGPMADYHRRLLAEPRQAAGLAALADAAGAWRAMSESLGQVLDDPRSHSPNELSDRLMAIEEAIDELPDFLPALAALEELPRRLASAFRTLDLPADAIEAAIVRKTVDEILRDHLAVRRFSDTARGRQVQRLEILHELWLEANAMSVREAARDGYHVQRRLAETPAAQLTDAQKDAKKTVARGLRELTHEFGKQMRYKPIRDLVAGESGVIVRALKPIWLMSPLSVSDTLPLRDDEFDVVIFDEASQITLEEAVPSLFRGRQAIVVGDEMQLPPTNFFSARSSDEDDLFTVAEEDGETVEYDLSANSFLNHAGRNLPSVMLGWHYRSRSEALISFSNCAFYSGRLLTVPDEDRHNRRLEEIAVARPEDAERYAADLLQRAVSFHFVGDGVYENRRNRGEADYIAHLVRQLIRDPSRQSIGIVAFSEAQQDEIERALDRLARDDERFAAELEAEYERDDDGQFAGLLVKNLENIQGDERDTIIMSVCYGPNPEGKMRMNFGPINQAGGEKRLNVAFSRARHHMALVSSIRHEAIRNDYNDGARCLKNYLRYAAATSVNDLDAARAVLDDLAILDDAAPAEARSADHPLVAELKAFFESQGYEVDLDVGLSHFRCDLAVRETPGQGYALGLLVDSERYYRQADPLERDLFKPRLLRAFGWRLATVLTRDYYDNPDEVRRTLLAIARAERDDAPAGEGLDVYRQHIDALLAEAAANAAPQPAAPPPLSSVRPPKSTPRPVDQATTASGADELAENRSRYLEFVHGSSRKFWEITVSGCAYSVRFGRIGTAGQERARTCQTAVEARRQAAVALRSKLAKGYVEKPRPTGDA